MEELDRAGRVPTFMTECKQSSALMALVDSLPLDRCREMYRTIENLLQKETIVMSDQEWHSMEQSARNKMAPKKFIVLQLSYGLHHKEHYYFETIDSAANVLFEWNAKNHKNKKLLTMEQCIDFFKYGQMVHVMKQLGRVDLHSAEYTWDTEIKGVRYFGEQSEDEVHET